MSLRRRSSIVGPPMRWANRAVWGAAVALPENPDDPVARRVQLARRQATVGVVSLLGALLVLGGLHTLGTPAFAPPDETAHVGYAFALLDGEIPHITDFPDDLPVPGMRDQLSLWTANHPPLPYLLMAIPLGIGEAVGTPLAGFWLARMLNVVGLAVGVLLVARVAATVLPHRPRAVLGTAMIAALTPYMVQISGTAYTDGLALPFALGIVAVSVSVLVNGPTRARLLALAVLGALGVLTRAPTAMLVLLSGFAWAGAVLAQDPGPLARRLRDGIGGAALIGLAAFVAAGWFYLGNIAIYGDPTGSQALFDLHLREPRGDFWAIFTQSQQFRFQELQLWSKIEGLPVDRSFVVSGFFVRDAAHPATKLALWLAAGATLTALWQQRRALPWSRIAAWAFLSLWWWALYAMMTAFVAGGGAPHARYLWPGIAGLALLLVVGLEVLRLPVGPLLSMLTGRRLPRRLQALADADWSLPVGLLALFAALVWANLTGWPRALELWQIVPPRRDMAWATVEMLAGRQIPAPGWLGMAAMGVLALCLATVAWALLRTPAAVPTAAAPDAAPDEPRRVHSRVEATPVRTHH